MNRGYARFALGETMVYSSASTPKGILAGILKALAHRGVKRNQIIGVDVDALENQFDKIDERAFERLLSAAEFHGLQIVVVEAAECTPRGVVSRNDQGTLYGHVG